MSCVLIYPTSRPYPTRMILGNGFFTSNSASTGLKAQHQKFYQLVLDLTFLSLTGTLV